jgi:aminopeptidase YwaD
MLNLSEICVERPLGTKGNNDVINLLHNEFASLGYKTTELPFDCTEWQSNESFIEQNGNKIKLFPSPFSRELKGNFQLKYVSTLKELQNINDFEGILVFTNELSKNAVMPKNFPFYFPDNDKLMYEILESIKPKGIVAITGQDPVSGLNPFPIFEDANFKIPASYVSSLENIVEANKASIEINSKTYKKKSKQLVFRKEGMAKEIILIAAHIDSKYFTDGAIDNASGVYTLYEIASLMKDMKFKHTIEIVPFNGEDSPEVSGQLAYMDYLEKNNYKIKFVVNIDGVGYINSKNSFSFYNFDEILKNSIVSENNLLEGEQWYSGDHGMFVFQEIPCIAITASNMFTDLVKITHTNKDKIELLDIGLLKMLSKTIVNIVEEIDKK